MPPRITRNPLHGITLEAMLTELVARCGWREMGRAIDIRCFNFDPSIKSSLQFLRRTPWARAKVEALYLERCGAAPAASSAEARAGRSAEPPGEAGLAS
jgi:uncharacterized protein (DUF2132 family)